MHPFLMINDYLPNFVDKYSNEFPNDKTNFSQYLFQVIIGDAQELLATQSGSKHISSCDMEQYFKRALRKRQTETKQLSITVDELVPYFLEECSQRFITIHTYFAKYLIHLLIRDTKEGLELNGSTAGSISICKIEQFLENSLNRYQNPLDVTICNMKMTYFFKNSQGLKFDSVKAKYEFEFQDKLKQLTYSVLQYPETSNPEQLEEMFVKMQVFIIANYHIGCPKNHVLLRQTRQSLNSVLGKGDLQKYILKKRYHRLEYLQKLGATVAGILIFNNQNPEGDKENMRNIFADLKMAQCNTKESLEEGIKRSIVSIQKGTTIMQELVEINVHLRNVQYLCPLIKVKEINKFVILFDVYKRNLLQTKEAFEKTQHLIEVAQNKFSCVVNKINEILKYRSAIESVLIFPHFVYLSEVWSQLVLYLNHLVEINRIKDHLDELVNEKLENKFHELVEQISNNSINIKHPMNTSFHELMVSANKREGKLTMLNVKPFVKEYCSLTMALTDGILVPAKLEKKLCEISFGFANIEFAKFAEHNLNDFIYAFRNAILTSMDLILLFQLDDEVIQQDFELINKSSPKTKSFETQTEMIVENDVSASNQINTTWNVWDFHRETIKLANIRQRHTHSTQSKLCYGLRNVQIQSCNTRHNYTQK